MILPNPQDMELKDWADAVTLAIANYPESWGLGDEGWQRWGTHFFSDPFFSRYDPPNPYQYDNWREWALKLSESMAAAPGSPR